MCLPLQEETVSLKYAIVKTVAGSEFESRGAGLKT